MRVYFDASVLIAALLSPFGGSALLLTLVRQKHIIGIVSQTVIQEIQSHTNKLHKSHAEIEQFIALSGLVVREAMSMHEIKPYIGKVDVSDAHVIAGAIRTKCTHLVSLDKKYLVRADIQKLFLPLHIVSPKELLEAIVVGCKV
jgi:putative PIN family toxin of toxin-antitoxin system